MLGLLEKQLRLVLHIASTPIFYCLQKIGGAARQHAESIDICRFEDFLKETFPVDFDVMLEIKDKEKSAIKAVKVASHDSRFLKTIENWSRSERNDKS